MGRLRNVTQPGHSACVERPVVTRLQPTPWHLLQDADVCVMKDKEADHSRLRRPERHDN